MGRRSSRGQKRELTLPLLWFPRMTYRPPGPVDDDPELASMREAALEHWQPRAPVGWPLQAASLIVEVALTEYTDRLEGRAKWVTAAIFGIPLGLLTSKLTSGAERRRGERLGVTPTTSPEASCLPSFIEFSGLLLILRAAGWRRAEQGWPRNTASHVVAEIERRRSWNRAFALAKENEASASAQ
jgi:hypothetical protein